MKRILDKIKRVNIFVPIIFSVEFLISFILLGGFEDNSQKQGDIFFFAVIFTVAAVILLNLILYFIFKFLSKHKSAAAASEKHSKIASVFIKTNLLIVSSFGVFLFITIAYVQIMITLANYNLIHY